MGGQQHARGGGAMRRDARPPRASDGRGASALTPWLFLSRTGQFAVKWNEGAQKEKNRDNGTF